MSRGDDPPPFPAPPFPAHVRAAPLLKEHVLAAHGSLALAAAVTAARPEALAATALHPWVLACTHLVTVGAVAVTCVGAWHAVLPIALRTAIPAGGRGAHALDRTTLALLVIVATGVAFHMAVTGFAGVAWSGALLLLVLAVQLPRWLSPLRRADAPAALRFGAAAAWVNFAFAAVLGTAVAADRATPFLGPRHGDAIVGHAHLALVGFAGTLAASLGLRLLPMFLPAAPPRGALPWVAVTGLALGGLAAGAGAPFADGWLEAGGALQAAGAAAFLLCSLRMLRSRKPPHPDAAAGAAPSRWLVLAALSSFLCALGLGVAFLCGGLPESRWRTVYGFVLLVGGLCSLILGVGQRLLPLAARLAGGPGRAHVLPSLAAARVTAFAWPAGVAVTAAGIAWSSPGAIRTGALLLLAAVLADLVNLARVRVAAPRSSGSPAG